LEAAKQFVKSALQRLTNMPSKGNISVAVVLKDDGLGSGARSFQLFVQYPEYYDFPPEGLSIKSAAGHALHTETIRVGVKHGLVYIPNTQHPQGILLWADERGRSHHYSEWAMIEQAFTQMTTVRGEPPKSLVCTEILRREPSTTRTRYVLCLDARKRNSFRDIHFQAVQAVANAIGMVLNETES
jgi:hypothetical protein